MFHREKQSVRNRTPLSVPSAAGYRRTWLTGRERDSGGCAACVEIEIANGTELVELEMEDGNCDPTSYYAKEDTLTA